MTKMVVFEIGDFVHMPPADIGFRSEGRVLDVLDDETVLVRFDRGDYFEDEVFPVVLLKHSEE